MRAAALDFDLGKQRKADGIIGGAELFDLRGVAGFLASELVAGKAEHRKAARTKRALQRLEALILRRESAGARGIDDQENLTFISLQRNVLAHQRGGGEIVNACHRDSFALQIHSARGINRRRWRSPGFNGLACEQTEI